MVQIQNQGIRHLDYQKKGDRKENICQPNI